MIVVLNLFDLIPGREADYARYLREVQPILDRHGARVLVYGLTRAVYWGDCTQEYCGLIAYPDLAALRRLSHDADFQRIRPLRDESTRHYILTTIEAFPGLAAAAQYLEERARQA